MMLVIEDEAGTRSVVPFAADAIVVGRGSEGVTFRLPDRNVSRRHARFLRQSGSVFVDDLGSLTGTRVNGERISGRRRLREGDLVQIGDYDLAVLAEGTALAPGAPPPLPAAPRPDPAAVTVKIAALADVRVPSPPDAPRSGGGRAVRLLLAAGLVALAVAIAAGLAGCAAVPPEAPAVIRP